VSAPVRTPKALSNDIQEAICDAWRIEHLARMASDGETEWGQHVAMEIIIILAERMNDRISELAVEVEKLEQQAAPVVADRPAPKKAKVRS
jgi:hypothetical protein